MTSPVPAQRRTAASAITPYRMAVSVLLACAIVGIWWAFTAHEEIDEVTVRDSAVAYIEPEDGEQALRQDRIFVRLAPNYTGTLFVNGAEIPEDQLDRSEGPHTMGYTPSASSETGPLPPGVARVRVIFWEIERDRSASRSYGWSFTVT